MCLEIKMDVYIMICYDLFPCMAETVYEWIQMTSPLYDLQQLPYYPLVICYIAIENDHRIVSFPMNSMVIFHSYVTVYQRVTLMLVDDDMSINHHFFERWI